jgi:hypothetical protein
VSGKGLAAYDEARLKKATIWLSIRLHQTGRVGFLTGVPWFAPARLLLTVRWRSKTTKRRLPGEAPNLKNDLLPYTDEAC